VEASPNPRSLPDLSTRRRREHRKNPNAAGQTVWVDSSGWGCWPDPLPDHDSLSQLEGFFDRNGRHVFRPEDAQLVAAVSSTEFGLQVGERQDGNKVICARSRPNVLQRSTGVGYPSCGPAATVSAQLPI
jgi:hypothetical protein